jgi:LysM repeat protein
MRFLLFILLVFSNFSIFAQTQPKPATAPPVAKTNPTKPAPSILLSNKDTLYLTIEENGKKLIYHRVKAKQTLFSLAKFYCLSLEELYEYNPRFQTDPVLRTGELIAIPTPNVAIKRYRKKGEKGNEIAPLCYVVQHGDNLYQICKKSFEMPVDSIKKRNNLKNNNITPGQLIHVGWIGTQGFDLAWRKDRKPTANDALKSRYEQQKVKYKEVSSQGICHWNKDNSEVGDLYAMHREAAIGTTIAVTNPATKSTVFCKVIGRIPNNYANNAEVIVSPAAAKKLAAKETDFMTKVRFLK